MWNKYIIFIFFSDFDHASWYSINILLSSPSHSNVYVYHRPIFNFLCQQDLQCEPNCSTWVVGQTTITPECMCTTSHSILETSFMAHKHLNLLVISTHKTRPGQSWNITSRSLINNCVWKDQAWCVCCCFRRWMEHRCTTLPVFSGTMISRTGAPLAALKEMLHPVSWDVSATTPPTSPLSG